jgi:hypothetical protein
MRDVIKMDLFPESVHDLRKFYGIPVIFREIFFQEKKAE